MIQSLAIVILASGFFLFFKANLPQKIFSEEKPKSNNVVIDSLLLEAIEEEKVALTGEKEERLTSKEEKEDEGEVIIIQEEDLFSNESEAGFKGMVFLDYFFGRLYQLETQSQGRVRIAYYGDSMTDGDMIVQDLRKNYQDKYGGSGVGFVQITSESAQSRGSVTHKYSSNWKVQSYLNVKRPLQPFGIGGQVFFVKDTVKPTWVSYQAGNIRNMTTLNTPTLYFGRSNNTRGVVEVVTNKDTLRKTLQAYQTLNKVKLNNGAVKQLKLHFVQADSIPLYGLDFSSATGVQVDNYSSRGNSGLPLSLFNVSVMQKFQKELDYSLIILHYGTNVLNYGSYNYGWYTKQMKNVVSHLRQCFPKASILVISTADKSTKYNMTMETDSAVTPLMRAQRKYAMESKTGFFNLYEAMGGKGSMVKWVEESPVKANKDYTHFNFRGAQAVSSLIFKQLEEGYVAYKAEKGKDGDEPVIKRKERTEQTNKVQKEIDTVSNDKME
ncbi:hypothetical protein [Myroides sp. WP-1]|uniref:hypothetical protein n=1 Tax=Myroides sp. WP-1 TaxID=2759944 RepID=UPI0015F7ECBA|nr:hypothetical protein [Myroides sp. WP-1]MBB1138886.1 hypothetical protein [Myroides sp. WP-1]